MYSNKQYRIEKPWHILEYIFEESATSTVKNDPTRDYNPDLEYKYIFQYPVKVRISDKIKPEKVTPLLDKRIKWIKKNYKDILNICYNECRSLRGDTLTVSEEEFGSIIEPVSLEVLVMGRKPTFMLTFQTGRLMDDKYIMVEISNRNHIKSVLLRS